MSYLVVALLLLLAFTIGLNLGLHGVIVFSWHAPFLGEEEASRTAPATVASSQPVPSSNAQPTAPRTVKPEDPKTSAVTQTLVSTVTAEPGRTKRDSGRIDRSSSSSSSKVDAAIRSVLPQSAAMNMSAPNPYDSCPVVLLTANRPELLAQTLTSLLAVSGVTADNLLVVQDGSVAEVTRVISQHNLKVIVNKRRLRTNNGAALIAQHYLFALTQAFAHFSDAQCLVVVEDDLLFAPDFYEYLTTASRLLTVDETAWIVSAWNDNGFVDHVRDPYRLMRTDYFPGLGWLLTRKLFEEELRDRWPAEHWDHWMRSPAIHKHREIVFPQVPRTFHNGVRGTFMTQSMHNQYFRDIAVQSRPDLHWRASSSLSPASYELSLAKQSNYESRIQTLLSSCTHIRQVSDLFSMQDQILCVWINVDPSPDPPQPFARTSQFFHLWHEHRRGNHRGLHEFYFLRNYVLLLNVNPVLGRETYLSAKPKDVPYITISEKDLHQLQAHQRDDLRANVHVASGKGQSCHDVCKEQHAVCDARGIEAVNSDCSLLREVAGCSLCEGSMGAEQPARVQRGSQLVCLVNHSPQHVGDTCTARHPDTERVCVCKSE